MLLRGEEAAGWRGQASLCFGKRCFCTLPSALRGSLSTRMNERGTLNDASFSRQMASRSPGSIAARCDYISHGNFAAHSIGRGSHRGFGHAVLLLEELLDLSRIDVEAAGDNQVALASAQGVIAVGRARGDVAGAEIAVDESRARSFVAPPIARENVGTFQMHFADFAVAPPRGPSESSNRTETPGKGRPTLPGRRSPT